MLGARQPRGQRGLAGDRHDQQRAGAALCDASSATAGPAPSTSSSTSSVGRRAARARAIASAP